MTENEELDISLRQHVIKAAIAYYEFKHKNKEPFTPGNRIPYAGRVFDDKEIVALVDSSLDFWLTAGRYADKFEKNFAGFLGVKHCLLTNSGSSANLLAFMALTSPKLRERRIKRGDEIITVAAAFPTTVSPIIQYGAVPVFIDVTLPTYNIDCSRLDKARSRKTKAVMLAHTLGNPFDLVAVKDFCDTHGLWLIEDNCDALGSKYLYNGEWRYTGTIGHIGTSSFYPPHHMTMGEGGAVYTNDGLLKQIIESFRDWGRDCWCKPGVDNTCGRRFKQRFGDLPAGYDHKYVYSHIGYNLKVTDMQAAVGVAQLEKMSGFIELRKRNYRFLMEALQGLYQYLIFSEPTPRSEPAWFGFPITVKTRSPFTRNELMEFLDSRGIGTRLLFAGNLTKQPAYRDVVYRVSGDLKNTDLIMNSTFWVGTYPGLSEEMLRYMASQVHEFVKSKINDDAVVKHS